MSNMRAGEESSPGPGKDTDDAVIARVRARVLAALRGEPAAQYRTVRADEGGWEQLAPGVTRKLLWVTPDAQSCLVRMAPGACVPPHPHPIDEECVVLEGSVRIGDDLVLQVGDFHVGRAGSSHALTSSATGALVYLRGAAEPA
ncbi:MAG TPA: cupin domain-containing protein [Ramlibacter sp.]|jgi:mannose-6-phosphate isomerase-like protein (cupin superfamily)